MTKKIICALVICVVLCSVIVVPISAYSLPFTDVKVTSWQYKPVKKVYDIGIMNGVSSTRFEPNKKLTRAEAAMMLYNLEGGGASYTRYSFKDVKAGAWYADAVEWMYKKGITSGVTRDRFGVNEYITRQDFVTLVYQTYKLRWLDVSDSKEVYVNEKIVYNFKDHKEISSYAMQSMKFCSGVCMVVNFTVPKYHVNVTPIISGHNGVVNPKGNCTRAEAAVIIGNVYSIDKCF